MILARKGQQERQAMTPGSVVDPPPSWKYGTPLPAGGLLTPLQRGPAEMKEASSSRQHHERNPTLAPLVSESSPNAELKSRMSSEVRCVCVCRLFVHSSERSISCHVQQQRPYKKRKLELKQKVRFVWCLFWDWSLYQFVPSLRCVTHICVILLGCAIAWARVEAG
jgi:hypothetical protein